ALREDSRHLLGAVGRARRERRVDRDVAATDRSRRGRGAGAWRVSTAIERIWAADGVGARALAPLSWLFGLGTGLRNALYDVGVLRSQKLALPAVSVGNLSVGGTGKTPVSAWVA